MKQRFNILIGLVIFAQACLPASDEELNVINDTLLDLIGTDHYLMPPPILPFKPIHPDSIDLKELDDSRAKSLKEELDNKYTNFDWEKYEEEVKIHEEFMANRPSDKRDLILLVSDTLMTYKRDEFLNSILTPEGFKSNFGVDPKWRGLVLQLVDSIDKEKSISLSDITETGKYKLKNYLNYEKDSSERVIGVISFSRVAFNEDYTEGCFYYSFVCGGECGEGDLIFVKKSEEGKWEIVGSRMLWVSQKIKKTGDNTLMIWMIPHLIMKCIAVHG